MRRMFAEPDGSTISDMLQAAEGTFEERFAWIVPSIKIIITGGMQEPGHSAGSTVLGLLTNPGQAAELAADPAGLVRPAVEEGLRWISPIGTQTRRATRDTVLAGIDVPAGANIGLLVSSANRDRGGVGRRRRSVQPPPAQASACGLRVRAALLPGHHLARMQERLEIQALFERCPNLRLDPDRPPRLRGWEFRAPAHLARRVGHMSEPVWHDAGR